MSKIGPGERIAKFIAAAGVCSRRDAEKLIFDGKVKLDGKIVTDPALRVTLENIIEVNGKVIKSAEKDRLWLYYKPVGLITTHKDPQNRQTVFASLKDHLPRVISIGRLDLNSEGLLLLTNNGKIAREFELPENNIERIYKVRAYGKASNLISAITKGVIGQITIDGITYKPKTIKLISEGKTNSWFEVTLTEGKNQEIRKIFAHFSLEVNRLIRIKYGKYELGSLKPGEFKEVV